jgi:murein DD-endopeptidase MepM/ murein hydrolase activator NlpD
MIRLKKLPLDDIQVTSEFGMRNYKNMWWHNGIDFSAIQGKPVYAVEDGITQVAKDNPTGYGLYIVVDHGNFGSLYAHLSKMVVSAGKYVKAGDIIGYSGNTGDSTGPHLHFEIRECKYKNFWERSKNDSTVYMRCVDPRPYIERLQYEMTITFEQAKKIVKETMGFDDNTMSYLSNFYKFSEPMLIKAARAVL